MRQSPATSCACSPTRSPSSRQARHSWIRRARRRCLCSPACRRAQRGARRDYGEVAVRKVLLVALAMVVVAALALPASAGHPVRGDWRLWRSRPPAPERQRRVRRRYADGASAAAARAAIKAAGGTILRRTPGRRGTVKSTNPALSPRGAQSALVGAARNRPIGRATAAVARRGRTWTPDRSGARRGQELGVQNRACPRPGALADKQWTCG